MSQISAELTNHEYWIMSHVSRLFAEYEAEPTSATYDAMFVLVGALKVLELTDSYAMARRRLLELVEAYRDVHRVTDGSGT